MRHITLVSKMSAEHQIEHLNALREGLLAHGVTSDFAHPDSEITSKHVACWGWRTGKRLRDAGHNVLVLERGYIGDRFKYTSIGWNGLNGHAHFPGYYDDGGKRFKAHGGIIKPWHEKGSGKYALILGQVPSDASLRGMNMVPWYNAAVAALIDAGHDVYFRNHPEALRRNLPYFIDNAPEIGGSLEDALSGAEVAACYNSNSAVDAVLAGVPCVVGDQGSMAWEVCSRNFQIAIRPDREQWAHALAWTQWEMEEIRDGRALEKIVMRP